MPDEYVHIVESPSPPELLAGVTEGRSLCSFLDTADIPYLYNLAVNREQFRIALSERVSFGCQHLGNPILHLSCHGGEKGIQLTDQAGIYPNDPNSIIEWSELSKLLKPIHDSVGGLAVCMSCCGGAHGEKMAHVSLPTQLPYACLIGTSERINVVVDAALAFAVLYRSWQRGDLSKALEAMRMVSGINDFKVSFSDLAQEKYRQRLVKLLRQLSATMAHARTGHTT